MAVILLSYFSTMVTVFAVLMFLLKNVFGSVSVHRARPEPHHLSAAARAMALEHYAAVAKRDEDARPQVAVLSPAAPQKTPTAAGGDQVTRTAARQTQKAKVVRLAHNEQRTKRLAEGQQGQGYSTRPWVTRPWVYAGMGYAAMGYAAMGYAAMGYAPDSRVQLAAARIFNTVGSIRTSR
jgi:hypothetical protein